MRVPYSTVFQINSDGSVSPKAPVQIGGVVMSGGVSFTLGVAFSGVDIAAMAGRDIECEVANGAYVIIRFY